MDLKYRTADDIIEDIKAISYEIDTLINDVFDEFNERRQDDLHPERPEPNVIVEHHSFDEVNHCFDATLIVSNGEDVLSHYEFFSITQKYPRLALEKIILALKARYADIDTSAELLKTLQRILLSEDDVLKDLEDCLLAKDNLHRKKTKFKLKFPLFSRLIDRFGRFLLRRNDVKWRELLKS